MTIYKRLVRPVLFRCDPERVHNRAIGVAALLGRSAWIRSAVRRRCRVNDTRLALRIGRLHFESPLGLAAGFDKNGRAIRLTSAMGFGHVEIGSISALPSSGNPGPRLFRLPADRAIVVNYGVPNEGAERVAQRLRQTARHVPLGVNLVATNTRRPRPVEAILEDFSQSARRLAPRADYLAISTHCPNSEGECDFLAPTQHLSRLLAVLDEQVGPTPVYLKIPAVQEPAKLEHLLAAADASRCVSGFALNLLPGKPAVLGPLSVPPAELAETPGAVSGKPCERYINATLEQLYRMMNRDRYTLIAAGGVFSAEDAYRKICLGASLVQIYTALVYEGPGVIDRIHRGLSRLLAQDGYAHVSEAVGADVAAPARPSPESSVRG